MLRRASEHRFAESAAHEFFDEPEVRDLDAIVGVASELEKPGGHSSGQTLPYRDVARRQVRRELVVGPRIAVVPMPFIADCLIQSAIVIDGD